MRKVLLFLTLLVSCSAMVAFGATYLVKPDGSGDFPNILQAVIAAQPGDVIELGSGTFTGSGNRDVGFEGKSITIRSQGGDPAQCIIDCQGSAQASHRAFLFINGEGPGAILEGVTIIHGYSVWGGGVAIMGSTATPRITNCVFSQNASPASEGGGICSQSDAAPLITNCVFADNTALCGGGMSATNGMGIQGPTLTGCTFYGNSASSDGGAFRM